MELTPDFIVKEDMICPITKQYCDDECCPVGAECNLSGNNPLIIAATLNELTPEETKQIEQEAEVLYRTAGKTLGKGIV